MKHTITRLIALILTLVIFAGGGRADQVTEEEEWIWPDAPKTHQEETPSAEDETEGAEMAKIETYFDCDLKKAVQVQPLNGNVFSLDNNGNRIGVRIFDNGVKTTVTGTVTGRAILADNSTVNLNGGLTTVNGQSVAYVDVPQGALLIPGTIKITIQLTASGVITTLAAILSTVYQTKTDNVITPSAQVIADWNATISSAIQAQDAAIAAETAAREAADSDLKSALKYNIDKIEENTIGTTSGTKIANWSEQGYGIFTGLGVGVAIDPTDIRSSGDPWRYSIVKCSAGDKFIVNSISATTLRAWCFVDQNNIILSLDNAGHASGDRSVTAPANTAYVIFNAVNADVYYGSKTPTAVDKSALSTGREKEYWLTSNNIASLLNGNLNNAPSNSVLRITIQADVAQGISNWPSDSITTGIQRITLLTYQTYYDNSAYTRVQLFIKDDSLLYTRYYESNSNTWSSWTYTSFPISDYTVSTGKNEHYWLTGNTAASFLNGDLNNAPVNSILRMGLRDTAISNIAHWPSQVHPTGVAQVTLVTYKVKYDNSIYTIVQHFICDNLGIYSRAYESNTGTWSPWVGMESTARSTIRIGTGQQYTSLTAGLAAAFETGNCDVFIEDGEYDIIQEGAITLYPTGIKLGKNNRYFFSSNSKVICHYEGSDANVMENFSCFLTGNGTTYGDYFELYNLTIDASKVRYCIHDEGGYAGTTLAYRHLYEGCDMKLDNSENSAGSPGGKFYDCIGGGLGNAGNIVIKDSRFNSVARWTGSSDRTVWTDVSYHGNHAGSSAEAQAGKSRIIVTGCYFAHAFGAGSPNTETQKKCLVFTNNTYNNAMSDLDGVHFNGTASETYWDIIHWNNVGRTE